MCMFVFTQNNAAAPGDLLLAKTILCPVSVIKSDSVQGGGATKRVRREVSILWLQTKPNFKETSHVTALSSTHGRAYTT